jgi:FkbM family methyltransferase
MARFRKLNTGFIEEFQRLKRDFNLAPQTILDVGANIGDFTAAALYLYPSAHIFAFEPLPGLCRKLTNRFSGCPVDIHRVALSDRDGTADFNLTAASTLSSLLKPTDTLASILSDGRVATAVTPIQVRTARLDTVLSLAPCSRPTLMKIDVQGTELQVLLGSVEQLRYVDCIKLEVNFEALYSGQNSWPRLCEFLETRGFLRFIQTSTVVSDHKARWCDLVFFRD